LQGNCTGVNSLNSKLNPICHLLALLAHHILHVSRIRVNDCLSAASSHREAPTQTPFAFMFQGHNQRLARLPIAWCTLLRLQAPYVYTRSATGVIGHIYNWDPWHLGNSILRLPTAGIHHPPWHQRRSTTSKSNQHQDSLHKGSTLFVLYVGAAVSVREEMVVVVWQTPLTRHAHCWQRLECYLASPKLPLPRWNAVFATWWFLH
jgi:hypothetical protein